MTPHRTQVLILSDQELSGSQVNAVGMRALQFATALANSCDVTVATRKATPPKADAFRIAQYQSTGGLRRLLASHDIVICQGIGFEWLHPIARSGARVVLDAYAPSFEILERFPGLSPLLTDLMYRRGLVWTRTVLWATDLVLSPNEKEADFLLGFMHAMGKLDVRLHAADPSVRSLLRVVPFGMPNLPPRHTRQVLKGVVPGVAADDFVLLWNSGIYGWLDASTLVRAMSLLRDTRPDIKLVLRGLGDISESGKGIPERYGAARAREALAVSKELGVLDRNVFFLYDRVSAEDVQNFLLEADVGVATYPDSLETRLCLGTRLFDFVWAGVPILTSRAPLLEEFVARNGIGLCAGCGDPEALARAITTLHDDRPLYQGCKDQLNTLRAAMTWDLLTEPLIEYCANFRRYPRPPKRGGAALAAGKLAFLWLTLRIKARTRIEERCHGR